MNPPTPAEPVPSPTAGRQVRHTPIASFPVAVDGSGRTVDLAVSHTLVIGKSGSGKGSVLQSIVRACLPYVAGGLVQLWGIDPKRAELSGPITGVYARIAHDPEQIRQLFYDLVELMHSRQGGRSFTASTSNPLIVVQMDEFTSMFDGLDKRQGDSVRHDLNRLLLQGRSAGIVMFAYGQEATKEATAMRDSFPQRVCLRVQTETEVDLVLGAGAVAQGAMAHLIPIASASNDYASAGIAFVRDDAAQTTRVRFPYTSDADLERLAADYAPAADESEESGENCQGSPA